MSVIGKAFFGGDRGQVAISFLHSLESVCDPKADAIPRQRLSGELSEYATQVMRRDRQQLPQLDQAQVDVLAKSLSGLLNDPLSSARRRGPSQGQPRRLDACDDAGDDVNHLLDGFNASGEQEPV
jgi:hypothetical protein